MNPIRIVVKPSRRWFGGRGQWRFQIIAGNGEQIHPNDTYANVGDIEDITTILFKSAVPVLFEVHRRDGSVETSQVR